MSEGSSPEQNAKGLRSFIDRAKEIRSSRNRGNRDAVLRTAIEQAEDIDELTGLPRRRTFNRDLTREVERISRYGGNSTLLFLDANKLKAINDGPGGHAAGDEYLRAITAALKRGLRSVDTVYRYGGDEFAVLLTDTKTEDVETIWSERLNPEFISSDISISAGSAPVNRDTAETISKADKALYGAKKEPNQNGENLLFTYVPGKHG